MPFTRISLHAGKSPEHLRAISDSLHQALVEAFEVPPDDRFQAIHQHAPGELVFDPHYNGGPRSADWVLFDVRAGRPRHPEVKSAFFRRLVELLGQSPGLAPADVMVVITTTEREDWSFADGRMHRIPGGE
jgi:phenylpyruvate tautomerase PptA (4-oxalocrotonate tautomerase family)